MLTRRIDSTRVILITLLKKWTRLTGNQAEKGNPWSAFPGESAHVHPYNVRLLSYISLVVNCAQLSLIAFAALQLNASSIVVLFKVLFTPKVGMEVCFCSIT